MTYGHQECNAPSPAFHQGHPRRGAPLRPKVAGHLLVDPKVARQAFLGEPVEEVMAMVKWAIKHEGDADFDPE
jgi:hypothetical protein